MMHPYLRRSNRKEWLVPMTVNTLHSIYFTRLQLCMLVAMNTSFELTR